MPLAKCAARSSRNEAENHGHVAKLAGQGYGFIETADGREVYFHRNSVRDDAFEHLTVASEVRFVEEMGEKGPQAKRVGSHSNFSVLA
jgi:cold shock CspA family protein